MSNVTIAACFLAITTASYADTVAKDMQGNSVRLTDLECPQSVTKQIKEEYHSIFTKAFIKLDKKDRVGCWTLSVHEGSIFVYIKYEDGGSIVLPYGLFSQEEGI